MSIYETTIKNPKKIEEFYKQLSEQKDIEIKQLKEQNEYLRRSIERKESTITELEQEKVSYTNEYVKMLEQKLEKVEKANKEAIELIKGVGEMAVYTKSMVLHEEEIEELLEILDTDKGE